MDSFFKRTWMRLALRGVHYSDQNKKLDRLYRVKDPWNMESEKERHRFEETNRLILEKFGHVGGLLEVGCGEGHQSQELRRVCDRFHGLDVSSRAVQRAQERCPDLTFMVGEIFDDDLFKSIGRFDLVVACEVIYYMADTQAVIRRLSSLGKACLVTYYEAHAPKLDRYLAEVSGVQTTSFSHSETNWKAFWWRNETV
jgi:predicted TPR repeat methyltransferase